jgi:hypothetical protein
MNSAKVVLVILGLLVLAAAAYYAVPYLSSTAANAGAQITGTINENIVNMLNDFTSKLESSPEYSYCMVKSVVGQDASFTMNYIYTVNGKDYAMQTIHDEHTYRQLYKEGKYTFIDDTDKIYYPDANNIGVPDVHLKDAMSGKPVGTGSEIVNGYQQDFVRIYKDGTVYVFYFDMLGKLVRFYYVYDSKSVALDFCRFVIGHCPSGASFEIPVTYSAANVKPTNID